MLRQSTTRDNPSWVPEVRVARAVPIYGNLLAVVSSPSAWGDPEARRMLQRECFASRGEWIEADIDPFARVEKFIAATLGHGIHGTPIIWDNGLAGGADEWDCDSDLQCAGNLICREDVGPMYGLPAGWDVCEAPGRPPRGRQASARLFRR